MSRDNRPTNLDPANLLSVQWTLAMFASISHRATGIILFVGIAFALWALQFSLSSEQGCGVLKSAIKFPVGMLINWGLLSALPCHFVISAKHLLQDFGIAEAMEGSRIAARVTIAISFILVILIGIEIVSA
jgi:succinate dehydrogenase / fumarate reductase cytochrome b subunit